MKKQKPPESSPSNSLALTSRISKRSTARPLSALQQRLQKRLASADFRKLNESMYTSTGATSQKLMQENPHLFTLYHNGYSEQVRRWPRNPLDDIIKFLSTQPTGLRIADLGCGDAKLARQLPKHDVKSFDLVARDDSVIACDIASVPLRDSCIDVAVFCLSLMGTNYGEFLTEARRILVPGGLLFVAEVASRFGQHDPQAFVGGVEGIGFKNDEGHPLVREDGVRARSKGKRRKGGGRKAKRKKMADKEEDAAGAFFFKFAFRSTKTEVVEEVSRKGLLSLPKLGACVYKKR